MQCLRRLSGLILLLAGSLLQAQPSWTTERPAEPPRGMQLGVLVEELSMQELDTLQLPYGLRITRVFPDSPARAGGLRPGDIILQAAGQPVFSVARLRWLVQNAAPGTGLQVEYQRDGRRARTELQPLGSQAGERTTEASPERGWAGGTYLGVSLQPLTRGLREAFATPPGVGVLIAEVYPDSPASEAGLRAGDVIVRMDRRTIREIADVYRVLDYFEPGARVTVEVIREGENREQPLTLGARPAGGVRRPGPQPPPGHPDMEPFLDPDWWNGIERFIDRWREYFEQRRAEPPAVVL